MAIPQPAIITRDRSLEQAVGVSSQHVQGDLQHLLVDRDLARDLVDIDRATDCSATSVTMTFRYHNPLRFAYRSSIDPNIDPNTDPKTDLKIGYHPLIDPLSASTLLDPTMATHGNCQQPCKETVKRS